MKQRKVNPERLERANPEWAAADFSRARRITELDAGLQGKLREVSVRGKQKAPTKQLVSLRLSPEVLSHYKATGPGWQTRIDQTLKRVVSRAAR